MSGKATKAEIAALVMPVTAATALAPALAFAGHSCAIPISVAAAIFVTGGWYCWLAAAPPPDEVEETRRRLWLRYNPAQADAAGAAATLTAAIPAEARSAETEAALQSLTGAASNAAGEGDRAIVYVERVLDRQINKLRGVLSFDALLMAFLSVERGRVPPLRPVLDFATACLAPLTIRPGASGGLKRALSRRLPHALEPAGEVRHLRDRARDDGGAGRTPDAHRATRRPAGGSRRRRRDPVLPPDRAGNAAPRVRKVRRRQSRSASVRGSGCRGPASPRRCLAVPRASASPAEGHRKIGLPFRTGIEAAGNRAAGTERTQRRRSVGTILFPLRHRAESYAPDRPDGPPAAERVFLDPPASATRLRSAASESWSIRITAPSASRTSGSPASRAASRP